MEDVINGQEAIVWYGPHACAVCGGLIIKASREQGGAELDPPVRLMEIYRRGATNGDPATVYPMVWAPHVHLDSSLRPPS